MKPTFSVLIPAYKSEGIIGETIQSILNQTFTDFELIIIDDNSPDKTEAVIKKFKDPRIRFFKNEKNLGYSGNLEICRQKAVGKYLFFMGNDDILAEKALERTAAAFKIDPDVGVVTRPYFWFQNEDPNQAVRVVKPFDPGQDRLLSINKDRKAFQKVIESVGQLSGLAYRRDWFDIPVHPDIFPAHIYPFLSIFKKHKAVYLKDHLLAVRIQSSQTRSLSSIYEPSPTLTWVRMFRSVLKGEKHRRPREWGVDYICQNYAGLIQLKNHARFPLFYKEIGLLIKYRPKNLYNPKFWFYVIGLTIVPRFLLITLVDFYKSRINSRSIRNVRLISQKGGAKTSYDYDKNYYAETGMAGFESEDRMDHDGILRFGEIKKGQRVLEIGCGLGILLSKIPVKEKFGLESNSFAASSCRKKGLNVKKHDNAYNLPFPSESFDVVIMNEVIEHIPNPPRALGEIHRVLKKQGKIIITTPGKNLLVRNLAQSHCSEMTFRELKQLVTESGFKIGLHKVRGLSIWDFLGRKIIFPVGRALIRRKTFSKSVGSIRSKVDHSKVSHFRDNFVSFAAQQLLIAKKHKR